MRKVTLAIATVIIGALIIAAFGVKVDASSQRTERHVENKSYSVEAQVPVKYQVASSRGYRSGIFDVADYQEITLLNTDNSAGTFQVNCSFVDRRGGKYTDKETLVLVPRESKVARCKVDTYRADDIT